MSKFKGIGVELEFKIEFTQSKVRKLSNVGELLKLIEEKAG
jgi:acyl carrier protein